MSSIVQHSAHQKKHEAIKLLWDKVTADLNNHGSLNNNDPDFTPLIARNVQARLKELEKTLKKYRKAYDNDEPLVSDAAYDKLEDELRKLNPKSSFFKKVGSEKPYLFKIFLYLPFINFKSISNDF